jgi:hypothetical protein
MKKRIAQDPLSLIPYKQKPLPRSRHHPQTEPHKIPKLHAVAAAAASPSSSLLSPPTHYRQLTLPQSRTLDRDDDRRILDAAPGTLPMMQSDGRIPGVDDDDRVVGFRCVIWLVCWSNTTAQSDDPQKHTRVGGERRNPDAVVHAL